MKRRSIFALLVLAAVALFSSAPGVAIADHSPPAVFDQARPAQTPAVVGGELLAAALNEVQAEAQSPCTLVRATVLSQSIDALLTTAASVPGVKRSGDPATFDLFVRPAPRHPPAPPARAVRA